MRHHKNLQQYLKGNLTESEKRSFEEEVMNNPELTHQLNQQRFMQQQKITENLHPSTTDRNNKRGNWLTGILIVVVTACCLFAVFKERHTKTEGIELPQQHMAENNTMSEVSDILRSFNTQPERVSRKENTENDLPTYKEIKNNTTQEIAADQIINSLSSISSSQHEKVNEYNLLAKLMYASTRPTGHDVVTQNGSSINNEKFIQGMTAYSKDNDWQKSVEFFNQIEKDDVSYPTAQQYMAHAFFKMEAYKSAQSIFAAQARSKDSARVEEAEWFLLLTLLNDYPTKKQDVNELLGKILSPVNKHRYQKQARYLREDLDKLGR